MMDSKLSRLCDGILEAGWLAAIISVPLYFNIHSERVFEPDKLTLMRSIAVFMVLVWLVKFIDQKGWQNWGRLSWRDEDSFWRQPFVLPIFFLVIVYLISSAFSVTPRASWAGSYQRLQGTYTTFSYIVIGGIAAATIRNRAQIGRIVTAVILTSLPVSFYGLLQHFGLDPLPWGGNVTRRVAGHMGNAIFIAAYLIMVVPLTLGRIVDAFTNILSDEDLSFADVIRSGIYVFLLGIQLLSIYWSGSRGPLIALATALFSFVLILLVSLRNTESDRRGLRAKEIALAFLFLAPSLLALLLGNFLLSAVSSMAAFVIYMAVVVLSVIAVFIFVAMRIGWRWLWLSWLLLTTFVGVWLLLFNVPEERMRSWQQTPVIGSFFETQLAWKELPVIGSYGRMLDPSQNVGREKSNRVRVLIWEGVVDLITPHEPLEYPDGGSDPYNFLRPLIGYGPESMYQAYNRFYPPELATVEARNATPDRSHNETFDSLVITGLAGFLAWQFLYVSVFYYGFRYLGVVGSRRDRNLLLGAWIGGGLLGGVASLTIVEPIYFGVAVPTGTIVGLIVYLFYYALFGARVYGPGLISGDDQDNSLLPFQVDRLLMNAVLAAVLAHYVEIHFGIAIAATRLHFFIFVALIYLIVYKMPRIELEEDEKNRRRSRAKVLTDIGTGRWGAALLWAFLLALMIGILGYEFTNYVLPPSAEVASGADLTAGQIFHQSLFINAQEDFRYSPFVYLLIVLSWILGSFIVFSEMVKQNVLSLSASNKPDLPSRRRELGALALGLLAVVGMGAHYVLSGPGSTPSSLGSSAITYGSIIGIWAAVSLLQDKNVNRLLVIGIPLVALLTALFLLIREGLVLELLLATLVFAGFTLLAFLRPVQENGQGRSTALLVAAAGLVLALPVISGGEWIYGLVMALVFGLVLYLLWDDGLRTFLLPAISLGAISWIIGLSYAYLQSINLREALLYLIFYQEIPPVSTLYNLFFRPTTAIDSVSQLRVLEALQSIRFLSWFYIFLFSMVVLAGISLAWRALRRVRASGSALAYISFFAAFIIGIFVINQTNMRVVQADMIYKRGRPFDHQATMQGDPQNWDVAIAIYEEALERAPWEDYYYLFLGRAYLERSAAATDTAQRTELYKTAEEQLLRAQTINPLNTDHTANLARLYTRWYLADQESSQRAEYLQTSERYYQDALGLSPQNSIIRNEYARLALELKRDCEQALSIYQESLEIDPFYASTYFAMSDALVACAEAQTDESLKNEMLRLASETIAGGIERNPNNVRAWLQTGQILRQLGEYDAAIGAFVRARELDRAGTIPSWNIDYALAGLYAELGEVPMARALAEQALESAPPDIAAQIDVFLEELDQ